MTLILLYLLPSTHEKKKQVNRLIVMQRVIVLFKNGARTKEQSISYNGCYFLEYNYIQISA